MCIRTFRKNFRETHNFFQRSSQMMKFSLAEDVISQFKIQLQGYTCKVQITGLLQMLPTIAPLVHHVAREVL
jgi:hypothetical protein